MFCTDPSRTWKHCHHAPTMLRLMETLAAEMVPAKIQIALWNQTKSTRFGNEKDPLQAGHDPRQTLSPLPSIWTQEPFGINFIPITDVKLRAKQEDDAPTSNQWRSRAHMLRSQDPINYWMANYRQVVLPPDGVQLRTEPTVICYFASPFTS